MNEIITKLTLFERAQPNFLHRVTADIVELKIIVKIEYVHTFKEGDRHRRLEVRLRLLHKNPENRKERDFFLLSITVKYFRVCVRTYVNPRSVLFNALKIVSLSESKRSFETRARSKTYEDYFAGGNNDRSR